MLEGVIASLLAAVIIAVMAFLYRHGYFREWLDVASARLGLPSDGQERRPSSIHHFRREIVRMLLKDQSRSGAHRGQFGRSSTH
jgi:hypothetical protein